MLMQRIPLRNARKRLRPLKLPSGTLDILSRCLQSTQTLNRGPGGWDVDPTAVSDPVQFAFAYLDSVIYSKLDDGKPSPDKERVTWERFYEAEELCRDTNDRLKQASFGPNPFSGRSPYAVLYLARQIIDAILGPLDLDEVAESFAWGPGATTRNKRRQSHAAYKFSGHPESTIGNVVMADAAIKWLDLWGSSLGESEGFKCKIVRGNRIVTVPKSFKTDRTIAIEPCMNMFVQKGFGNVIRKRLLRAGCDLNDQTRNQRLACEGSISGNLATIDLSMASDTLSYELVRLLLPADWFDALEQARSSLGRLPSGDDIRYQKFSSMGNGYTFELESMIFFSIAKAVVGIHGARERRIGVFGDDIVVSSEVAEALVEVLEVAGFRTNASKTFMKGPFRESCGKHYFLGCDVTPFYVRRPITSLRELFLFHNNLKRWVSRVREYTIDLTDFKVVLEQLREVAPSAWRKPRIPDGVGDGAFIGTFDECTPVRAGNSLEGFRVWMFVDTPSERKVQPCDQGRLLASLYFLWKGDGEIAGVASVKDAPRWRVPKAGTLIPRFAGLDPF